MSACLFCRIAAGDIPARKAFEDDRAVAFHDINPQAPVHVLIVPRQHVASVQDATEENAALLGHLLVVANGLARQLGVSEDGYRLVINTGDNAGQTVHHLHVHLLGGRDFSWPPG